MQNDLNQRIEDILESTKGSKRAKPSEDLLQQIEQRIGVDGMIIPIGRLRLVAAAAALLLLVNILAVNTYLQSEVKENKQPNISLISDFKLYE